jgi:hypothetical protein
MPIDDQECNSLSPKANSMDGESCSECIVLIIDRSFGFCDLLCLLQTKDTEHLFGVIGSVEQFRHIQMRFLA